MSLSALGYIGINSQRPGEWDSFATQLLGMEQVDRGGAERLFRMDDRKQRLVVTGMEEDGLGFLGWEVPSAGALDAMASKLENARIAVTWHGDGLPDQRHVSKLISFTDPDGNRLELFCEPEIASEPFTPGRRISGFKTGSLGMGHAVLHVRDVDALVPFYRDLLGFNVTDYGLTPYPLYFFHINGRHHSFAMVGSGRRGVHHFMVELLSLDDVGQGYDIALQEKERLAYTLGRHSNDHMMSFYVNSPSGFFVEYGWGARMIEPATWEPHETKDGPSYWGHERVHLPEDDWARNRLREMRLDAAARGLRAEDPELNCAWLDRIVHRE